MLKTFNKWIFYCVHHGTLGQHYWMQDFYLKVDSICMLKTLLKELHTMGISEVTLNQ